MQECHAFSLPDKHGMHQPNIHNIHNFYRAAPDSIFTVIQSVSCGKWTRQFTQNVQTKEFGSFWQLHALWSSVCVQIMDRKWGHARVCNAGFLFQGQGFGLTKRQCSDGIDNGSMSHYWISKWTICSNSRILCQTSIYITVASIWYKLCLALIAVVLVVLVTTGNWTQDLHFQVFCPFTYKLWKRQKGFSNTEFGSRLI